MGPLVALPLRRSPEEELPQLRVGEFPDLLVELRGEPLIGALGGIHGATCQPFKGLLAARSSARIGHQRQQLLMQPGARRASGESARRTLVGNQVTPAILWGELATDRNRSPLGALSCDERVERDVAEPTGPCTVRHRRILCGAVGQLVLAAITGCGIGVIGVHGGVTLHEIGDLLAHTLNGGAGWLWGAVRSP